MSPSRVSTLALFFVGFLVGATFFSLVAFAWTGPAGAPPNSNVSAPVNIGTTDQVKNSGLSVNALAVFGNSILSGTTNYLNFGTIAGTTGYGIRNNAGVMEVKDTGGQWNRFATTTSTGAFNQIKFADGTVQTSAATAGLGANQVWSNPARSINTSYQNTTGMPIMVSYTALGNNSAADPAPARVLDLR